MAEIINNELKIIGASGRLYSFPIYLLPIEYGQFKDEEYGLLYIYFNLSGNSLELIYCGKDKNPPCRFNDHEQDEPHIINDSNYIACVYCVDANTLEQDEIDLLEGNKFKYNIQHNVR